MNYGAESATARLWRDKAETREQERNEARARTKIAEEKVAILTAENDRLVSENARLRAQMGANPIEGEAETEMQMEALRGALIPAPSLSTPTRMRAASGRTRTMPSPSIAIAPALANPSESGRRGAGMLSKSRRKASGIVSVEDCASADAGWYRARAKIRMRRDSMGMVGSSERLCLALGDRRGHSKAAVTRESDSRRVSPPILRLSASVLRFGLRGGCRIRSPSRQTLIDLFNGGLGWLPGLRAGVAQLSIAFGAPIKIRRLSTLLCLSLDRNGRQNDHGQQTRET